MSDTIQCTRCHCWRNPDQYETADLSATGRSNTCWRCRESQTPKLISEELIIDLDEFSTSYPSVDTIEIDDGVQEFVSLQFKGYVRCEEVRDLSRRTSRDNFEDFKRIAKQYVSLVESCDEYRYYIKNVGAPIKQKRIRFTAYCIQDSSIQNQETDDNARTRYRRRMETYPCGGTIEGVIDLINFCVHLDINHNHTDRHPPPPYEEVDDEATTEQIRHFIRQHAREHDRYVTDIHASLIRTYPTSTVSLGQVYYWWNKEMETQYKLVENQFESARMLIEGEPGFYKVSFTIT